jgi:hypothetical protein
VEQRHFGYGIARANAGHTHTTGPATATYLKAHLPLRHRDRPGWRRKCWYSCVCLG